MTERAKVLLVDDRPENLVALEGLLRDCGAQLLKAESGRRALELLIEHEVALAIIDVQMPEMDGFQLAELMRGIERTREIPIMFVTAGLHDRARVFKGYDSGAVDFLVKPLEPRVLLGKVRIFLELYQQKHQLALRVEQLEVALAERRRAEEILARSEALLRVAMKAGAVGSFSIDLVRGEDAVSDTYREILGLAPDQPAGVDQWLARIHPDDRDRMMRAYEERVRDGDQFQQEYRIVLGDGTVRWLESSGRVERDPSGRAARVSGIVHDITAAREATEQLKRERDTSQWLARLPEEAPEPVLRIFRDGKLLYANPSARTLCAAWDLVVGQPVEPSLREIAVRSVASRESIEAEIPCGGRLLWVVLSPAEDDVRVYGRDITARKQGEGFSRALNSINQIIHSTRRFDDIMQAAMSEASAALGADSAAVSLREQGGWVVGYAHGLPAGTVGTRTSDDEERHALAAVAERRPAAVCDASADARASAAHRKAWGVGAMLVVPLTLRHGAIGAAFFHYRAPFQFTDAHVDFGDKLASAMSLAIENARLFNELQQSERELREVDRRKNDFLAVLSHELRNPLAPIRNSLYILDRAIPGSDQARRAQQIVERQVTQLTNLVNDLLDVTRITRNKIRLQKERLELGDLVRRTVEDNRAAFEKNAICLNLDLASRPIWVNADGTRLAQILSNLLQNSTKFTKHGGNASLSLAVDEREAVVRMTDDGVGMSPEILSRLFQPFMQAAQALDRSKGGLGLGLALVKGLVELHGGTVKARSGGVGKGSEFEVRLPLDSSVPIQRKTRPVPAAPSRRRILIVEDNVDSAESLKEALALSEHDVAVAHDGPQALQVARDFRPELVICDIGLPGMNGYQVARAFRADQGLRHVHLIALSGYALPDDLQQAADAGFERHIPKPVSAERLAELLGSLAEVEVDPGGRPGLNASEGA